ncbi:1,4-alpha-glucan branching enzyme [Bulinus truncatus]|nr:1,4-alpha-glucan branching enzyme [Bulinus truncatus]
MIHLESKYNWFSLHHQTFVSLKHQDDKVIVFERADILVFVFNFHPSKSYTDYKIGVQVPGTYEIVLDSDAEEFHGHKELITVLSITRFQNLGPTGQSYVYIPSRTAIVLAKVG